MQLEDLIFDRQLRINKYKCSQYCNVHISIDCTWLCLGMVWEWSTTSRSSSLLPRSTSARPWLSTPTALFFSATSAWCVGTLASISMMLKCKHLHIKDCVTDNFIGFPQRHARVCVYWYVHRCSMHCASQTSLCAHYREPLTLTHRTHCANFTRLPFCLPATDWRLVECITSNICENMSCMYVDLCVQ